MTTKAQILEHFKTADPVIYDLLVDMNITPIQPVDDLLMRLIASIVGQQLSTKAARTLRERFAALLPTSRTAVDIVKLSEEQVRSAGLSAAKTRAVLELAGKVASGDLDLEALREASDETIYDTLTGLRGIGPWTAEMFLIFSLGREDIFSLGDLGLRNAARKLFFNGRDATPAQLERLSRRWQPYRSYAGLALWHSLDNEPDL